MISSKKIQVLINLQALSPSVLLKGRTLKLISYLNYYLLFATKLQICYFCNFEKYVIVLA